MKKILSIATIFMLLSSCVAKRYLKESQMQTAALRNDSTEMANQISSLHSNLNDLNGKIDNLNKQNSQLGQQSADQQNQLSRNNETLQQQQERLLHLQTLLAQQRQQSEDLKNRMLQALQGFNSKDLSVYEKNGKVYVSLSENLLFPSASAVVNPKGVDALSKLASVLNVDSAVSVDIEGHTDSIPIHGKFKDNWDLSTARANSIVRILVDNYKVDPTRVIASGHSYYDPIANNATPEGRAQNRRTDIVLSPKLDEMYKLLDLQ